MNTKSLTDRILHSRAMVLAVALLGGLALTLALPKAAYAQSGGPIVITDTFLHMESFTVTADSSWKSVNLSNTYNDMVIICTPNYTETYGPMVTRVRDASGSNSAPSSGNSFQLLLEEFGCDTDCDSYCPATIGTQTVHCLVMEKGAFTLPDGNDTKVEAQKYNSEATSGRNLGWNGENQSYLWGMGTYTNPVVLGQVMSHNDAKWSVFWACDGTQRRPPGSNGLETGKHISKEQDDTTRDDETIGFIAVEQGHRTLDTVAYEAWLGRVNVEGIEDSPPYDYSFDQSFSSAPEVGVVSHAGENGGDGQWPILYGANPLGSSQIHLAADESRNASECERSHPGTEQEAYWVFAQPLVVRGRYQKLNDPADLVNPGERITYTITYTDVDPSTYLVITDTYDSSKVNFGSASPGYDPNSPSGSVWWDLGTGNTTGSVTLTVQVQTGFTGTITNTAVVSATDVTTGTVYNTINEPPTVTVDINPQNVGLCASGEVVTTTINDPNQAVSQLEHRWTQASAASPSPIVTLTHPLSLSTGFDVDCLSPDGVVTFTLTVTDAQGLTASAWVTALVKNVPVEGLQVINNSTTTLGCKTLFTATIQEGSSVTYTWDFDDGTGGAWGLGEKVITDHVQLYSCVTTPVTYTVEVTAQNSFDGDTYSETVTTIVTLTNKTPTATADAVLPHRQAVIDSLVMLDGSASDPNDPCDYIDEYYWEQIGGIVPVTLSNKSAISPTFTAPSPPTLPTVITFTLTVTDSGCLTAMDTISITLVPPVGGHTEPVEKAALIWPWAALVAVLGAAVIVTVAALKRRGVSSL